ncbi:ribonuclease H1 small subunit [Thozetella sp. PMI_491]|nr:ribonuclease H1 small subunit [Thozetella sp. PMI_491]
MPEPILNITQGAAPAKNTTANLLPCRVDHSGSVEPLDPFWSVSQNEDGSKTAYLRGRKLHGQTLKLPEGYRGAVVAKTETQPPRHQEWAHADDQEREDEPEVGTLETKAEFSEVVVWGHETGTDAGADPYVRGIEEWIGLAEQIHSYEASK